MLRIIFTFLLLIFFLNNDLLCFNEGQVEIYKILINDKEINFDDTNLIVIDTNDKIEFFYHIKNNSKDKIPFLFKVDLYSKDRTYNTIPKRLTSKWFQNLPEADYHIVVMGISSKNDWNVIADTLRFRVNNFEASLLKKISNLKEELDKQKDNSGKIQRDNEIYYGAGGFIIGIIIALTFFKIFPKRKENIMESEVNIQNGAKKPDNKDLEKENANLKAEIAALRGQIDSLQKRGEELRVRNKELQNQVSKLSKGKEELEELQQQKDELFAMVIHDIKNPVALIKNLVELLRSYDLTATEQQEIIEDIAKTTNRIVSLSNEVTKILALESTNITVNVEKINMNDIVSDVLTRYEKAAAEKHIKIFFKPNDNLPECEIDILKIDDVLDNLISNAIKFTQPEGKVKVNVREENNHIVVEVSDTGQGLTEEDIKKAFKRGAMLSARPTGDENSSGLGLWIVKRLVDIHNGKVWIKSAVGKGSTFAFSVPIVRQENKED